MRRAMPVLLTGFEPFGGERVNPSMEIVRAFRGVVPIEILPNSLRRAPRVLRQALQGAMTRHKIRAVLHLGEEREATSVLVEQSARNRLDTGDQPDNDGNEVHGAPVLAGGPSVLRATAPVDRLVRAVRGAGMRARAHRDGGTHVSNQVFYWSLYLGRGGRGPEHVAFLHVPPVRSDKAVVRRRNAVSLWKLVRAVEAAMAVLVEAE